VPISFFCPLGKKPITAQNRPDQDNYQYQGYRQYDTLLDFFSFFTGNKPFGNYASIIEIKTFFILNLFKEVALFTRSQF
jgi:hypothetical protein